jgi:hypothetical protein
LAAKKTFVLRVDEDTFKAIEKWASDEFRSVNGHLEWLIDKALKDAKRRKRTSPTEASEEEALPNAHEGEEHPE